jgi:P pilus assembly chaperone PapD
MTMKNYMLTGNPVKKPFTRLLVPVFLIISVLLSATSLAQGDLLLYPKRIVFEGSKRTQDLNLANSGKDTARYILSVVQIRMKEDGSFETITEPDPGQNFADKYFRIFPRNVVLPPNEAQTVKVQLINTGELQPGEYRSHLYVRAEAEKAPLGKGKCKRF